jgi:hypothetical protein
VDFEHALETCGGCDDVDVGFFADANLVADAVDAGGLAVGVEG